MVRLANLPILLFLLVARASCCLVLPIAKWRDRADNVLARRLDDWTDLWPSARRRNRARVGSGLILARTMRFSGAIAMAPLLAGKIGATRTISCASDLHGVHLARSCAKKVSVSVSFSVSTRMNLRRW